MKSCIETARYTQPRAQICHGVATPPAADHMTSAVLGTELLPSKKSGGWWRPGFCQRPIVDEVFSMQTSW